MSSGACSTNRNISSCWWCLGPSCRAWKMFPKYSHSLRPESSSFSRGWPSSSVIAMRVSTGFFIAPCTLAISTSSQSNVFFCLCPREGWNLGFTCFEVFTSKAGKNLAESLEINTLEEQNIRADFNWFPSFATSHQCPKVSISMGTQRVEWEVFPPCRQVLALKAHVSSSFWLCGGELKIQPGHKMGQERICGRHEVAARWNRKCDVWTSNYGIRLFWF